jgi:hypothetical protein
MRYFTHISRWCIAIAAVVIMAASVCGVSWGGEEQRIISISPIYAPPEFRPIYLVDPKGINKGRIEKIDGHGVAVDGRYWRFSNSVTFLSGSGRIIDASDFKSGTASGFCVNALEEITAIWNLAPEYVRMP